MMNQPQQTTDDEVLALPGFDDEDDDDELPVPRRARRGNRRRGLVIISIVLLVLILGGAIFAFLATRRPRVTYTTQPVQQGTLSLTVNATGPVQGNIYNVDFSGSGKLSQIDVSVGQHVRKGQTLAKLDPASLQDAINQAQAAVNAAENSLGAAQNNLSNVEAAGSAAISAAYDTEQNALKACENSEGTPTAAPRCEQLAQDQYAQAVRQADSQNSSASTQIASAYGQLQTAEAQLQTAQDNLKNATLTAPHSGIVAVINGSVGGTPGEPTTVGPSPTVSGGASAFIEIVDTSSLQVYADVNEADIAGIQTGQTAKFTVSAYGSRQFTGTVKAISPLGQTVSNVVTYTVIIQVNMASLNGARLLPGMTANTTVTTITRPGTLLIPVDAVNFAQSAANPSATVVPANTVSQSQVQPALAQARQMLQNIESTNPTITQDNPTPSYVLELVNKQLEVKPVVLGLSDGASYEVLAGLTSGESVVTGAQQARRGLFAPAAPSGNGTGG